MNRALIIYIFAIAGFFLELFHFSVPRALRDLPQSITSGHVIGQAPCKSDDQSRISFWSDDLFDDNHGFQELPLFYFLPRVVLLSHYAEARASLLFFRPIRVHSPLVSSQGPPRLV